jgi:hypothetical protein
MIFSLNVTQFSRMHASPCVAGLALAVACAGITPHGADINGLPVALHDRSVSESGVIRQEEIRAKSVGTAYDAVRSLRPHFLTAGHADTLGRGSPRPVAIIDKGFPESIDVLKQIPADAVLEIQFIEPADAVTRFGARYTGGIVIVRLGRPDRPR